MRNYYINLLHIAIIHYSVKWKTTKIKVHAYIMRQVKMIWFQFFEHDLSGPGSSKEISKYAKQTETYWRTTIYCICREPRPYILKLHDNGL